ncbi:MAG TPA: RagB/SusD family nutrient uptake outer membrane protein [Puia sp.]|nr:RagB/SusD family nutrient uptake outer membrane protein [Puia sp.]
MFRLYKKFINNSLLLLTLSSCKKFVEINPPVTQLVTASVFNNSNTATAAQIAVYLQMNSNAIVRATGLSSDEFINFSNSSIYIDLYKNSLNANSDASGIGIWSQVYNYISQENAIIEGLQGSNNVGAEIKSQLIGEAKFVRAFWYFYLSNLYGDVPLVTSTNYKITSTIVRASRSLVYQQIIADLKDAQKLLNSEYLDATDTSVTVDRVRPTKWAATALLARVYLYTNDYVEAETQATSVINNVAKFSLKVDLDSVFLKNSTEAIWQLMPSQPSKNNTPEGNFLILAAAPSAVALSSQFLNNFETGDNRKLNWVKSITVSGVTYYYPFKYKIRIGSTITEYSMVLRLAEQYLIRSESRVQQSNIEGAASDLNAIRNRAGIPNTTANTKQQLLTAISHERQVELFTEWGHRWLDLKRFNIVDTVMGAVTPQKGGTWNSYQQLYPIPPSDLLTDIYLTQNLGY